MSLHLAGHHQRALDKSVERLRKDPDVVAVLLAGSLARQVARPDSDVDLIAVVTDEGWQQRLNSGAVTFFWRDVADWEGGYAEGRFLSESFILEAAQRGSEPTRHSFIDVSPVYCSKPAIVAALPAIPVYQEHERQGKIDAFMAQLHLNVWYFFNEGKRLKDAYLLSRAASEMVQFGGRLILAHNRILFPCHKRLMEYVEAAPEHPPQFKELAERLLRELSDEAKEDFFKMIESFTDWNVKTDSLTRFTLDVEMSWFTRSYSISEW